MASAVTLLALGIGAEQTDSHASQAETVSASKFFPSTLPELAEDVGYKAIIGKKATQSFEIRVGDTVTRLFNLTPQQIDEKQITQLIQYFEQHAQEHSRLNISENLLGKKAATVTYDNQSASETEHYFVIIPEGMPVYSDPSDPVPPADLYSLEGLTYANPGANATLSVIHMADGSAVGTKKSNDKNLFTEICLSTDIVVPTGRFVSNTAAETLGQEDFCKSYGKALSEAAVGDSYDGYLDDPAIRTIKYPSIGSASWIIFNKNQYAQIKALIKDD